MPDLRRMQLGQVVDFILAYNERSKKAEEAANKEKTGNRRRKATQADINAFFG